MKLKDQVAIITGASKGIGKGVAAVFAQEGAKVVLAANGLKDGEQAAADIRAAGGEALFVQCDVANEEQVKALVQTTVEAFGRLDILVNNAGIGTYKSILDVTSEEWDRCLAVNLKGVFLCSKYSIPHMQAIGKGSIINMSSVHAHATANGVAPYCASKGAITALTRNMAIDYGPVIRVNSIAPGWIWTPLIEDLFNGYDDPVAVRKQVEDRQVMKRIGTPEDVGYACAFLASEEASFITGTQLFVDGGLTAVLEEW
ncbi:SDR family NAD(P)-dependent oxidoreductase [Synechocystis sp. LKSZ1]|uniref:SDR family NAD(P)-dependent oxidoreductase n=1 Tax=Synechocystis sp. LKSZ1 TaxID=3144951 RepID=UPI00336BEDF8